MHWREWLHGKATSCWGAPWRVGVVDRMYAKRAPLPWWGLAIRDMDRDAMVMWFAHEWPRMAAWRWVLGPCFRAMVRVGVWRVEEMGLYVEGRPQWPDMWTRTRRWQ